MLKCNDCRNCVEKLKMHEQYVGEFWGGDAYEQVSVCPICESTDVLESEECIVCGKEDFSEEMSHSICSKCYKEIEMDMQHLIYKYGSKNKEELFDSIIDFIERNS